MRASTKALVSVAALGLAFGLGTSHGQTHERVQIVRVPTVVTHVKTVTVTAPPTSQPNKLPSACVEVINLLGTLTGNGDDISKYAGAALDSLSDVTRDSVQDVGNLNKSMGELRVNRDKLDDALINNIEIRKYVQYKLDACESTTKGK